MLIAGTGFSQHRTYLKAGLGATTLQDFTDTPYPVQYSPILSYQLGVGHRIPLTERLSLRGEVVYLTKGYTFSHYNADRVQFHCIGLSVVGAVKLFDFLELEGGLMPNRALMISNQNGSFHNTPYRMGDLALLVGAGIRLSDRISLAPTLQYGLFRAAPTLISFTDEDTNTLVNISLRQHHLQGMLSVRYML
ncbi:hypothetical protein [Cesiribacter andamanensis]|uniref:Outer membrane protein beta-barrel domain-containing protein n=1 Tax=Cesiribacter andamanensis AMV16 TaxID=1279009 RepID=M7N2D1_9BACT|nr:hypothetical protein [Cesiribacter andamanensis]EMR02818.1 hypothetical protein ADICEAN_02026 [Cesiribacter andamanensis AMV16]